jgi:hypothetical protein
MAKKKKGAMIVVAIALVAALAVTGTLMTLTAQSDGGQTDDGESDAFGINLWVSKDLNGNGKIDFEPVTVEGQDENITFDETFQLANNETQTFDLVPGGFKQQIATVALTEDSVDAYAAIKIETTINLRDPKELQWGVDLEDYYSKLAAVIYMLRNNTLDPAKTLFVPMDDWYYKLAPTTSEAAIVNEIISDAMSQDDFYYGKEGKPKGYHWVEETQEIELDMALPESVTLTGYLYYGENNGAELKTLTTTSGDQGNGMVQALNSVAFPAYQRTADFMDKWLEYSSNECDLTDFLVWNDTAGKQINFSDFFTVTETINVGEGENQTENRKSYIFVSADRYPLMDTTLSVNYVARAIHIYEGEDYADDKSPVEYFTGIPEEQW